MDLNLVHTDKTVGAKGLFYILRSNFRHAVLSDWPGTFNFLTNTLLVTLICTSSTAEWM